MWLHHSKGHLWVDVECFHSSSKSALGFLFATSIQVVATCACIIELSHAKDLSHASKEVAASAASLALLETQSQKNAYLVFAAIQFSKCTAAATAQNKPYHSRPFTFRMAPGPPSAFRMAPIRSRAHSDQNHDSDHRGRRETSRATQEGSISNRGSQRCGGASISCHDREVTVSSIGLSR
jgi:hypothetical protein